MIDPGLNLFSLRTRNFKHDSSILIFFQIYIGLPGCIKEFDELASKFTSAKKEEEKKEILRKAENKWDKVKGVSSQKSAEVYVKTMRKILEKKDFVSSETKRVENLLKGKISAEKTNELQVRLNILKNFGVANVKDEL